MPDNARPLWDIGGLSSTARSFHPGGRPATPRGVRETAEVSALLVASILHLSSVTLDWFDVEVHAAGRSTRLIDLDQVAAPVLIGFSIAYALVGLGAIAARLGGRWEFMRFASYATGVSALCFGLLCMVVAATVVDVFDFTGRPVVEARARAGPTLTVFAGLLSTVVGLGYIVACLRHPHSTGADR